MSVVSRLRVLEEPDEPLSEAVGVEPLPFQLKLDLGARRREQAEGRAHARGAVEGGGEGEETLVTRRLGQPLRVEDEVDPDRLTARRLPFGNEPVQEGVPEVSRPPPRPPGLPLPGAALDGFVPRIPSP
jgi:hypothetical protein